MPHEYDAQSSHHASSSPRAPALVIAALLIFGLSAAGWYIWRELSAGPAARPVQSFKLAPGAAPDKRPETRRSLPAATRPATARVRSSQGFTSFLSPPRPPPMPRIADPGPTLVTFGVSNASPEEAFKALAAAAKIDFSVEGDDWSQLPEVPPITYRAQEKHFWTPFFDLCMLANVYPSRYYDPAGDNTRIRVERYNPGRNKWPRSDNRSFSLVLSQLTRTFTPDLMGPNPREDLLRLQFALYAEPKLGARWVVPLADIEEATDETGASLVNPAARSVGDGNSSRSGWVFDLSAQLLPPRKEGGRLKRLRGSVTVIVQTSSEDFVIENPLAQRSIRKTIDGLEIEFKELRSRGNQHSAHFSVDNPGNRDPRIGQRFRSQASGLRLYNDLGQSLPANGSGTSGSANSFGFEEYFSGENVGGKSKLVLTIPVGLREIRVPFEFRDIPLP